MISLSKHEARSIAVKSQGFGVSFKQPINILEHLGVIQLDAMTTVCRSHEIVPFSRIGPYNVNELYKDIYIKKKGFEYWGHSASWLPMKDYKLFTHRMEILKKNGRKSTAVNKNTRSNHSELYDDLLEIISRTGEISSENIINNKNSNSTWWNLKPEKKVLEDLFDQGVLMCSNRSKGFKRYYDLKERVLPEQYHSQQTNKNEAVKKLLLKSIKLLGIGTKNEIADYYRLKKWGSEWKPLLNELIESEEVVEVKVEGWKNKGLSTLQSLDLYDSNFDHEPTLLSPFDNLIWDRNRCKNLFEFDYKLEFYKPKEKREFGYYVMPILINSSLVGRADLKFDRKEKCLTIINIWLEKVHFEDVCVALSELTKHLGGEKVRVLKTGNTKLKITDIEDYCKKKIGGSDGI